MGKVALARIDERLVHGQVMTNLSQNASANSIFIVDDEVAKDSFMKDIFINSGSRTGLTTKVYTVDVCTKYWNQRQFDNFSCILLTKTVDTMYRLAKNGIPITTLNLGGIAKKDNTTFVTNAVAINKEMADQLEEIQTMNDANVYFQTVPSSKKVSLAEGLKTFN